MIESTNAEAPLFGKYSPDELRIAIVEALKQQAERIDEIAENREPADFRNTLVELENSGTHLDERSALLFNLHSADTNDEIERAVEAVSPLLAEHSNNILLNPKLFARVKSVFEAQGDLDQVERRLLEKVYRGFLRNGALLAPDLQPELRAIDQRLALAAVEFGQNVLNATRAYRLELRKEQLLGLPEAMIEAAVQRAQELGSAAEAVITLDQPSYQPALTYLEDRALREQLYRAYTGRAASGEFDNRKLASEIAELRYKRARLLGFENHADFVLQERMAGSIERLETFLNELLSKARPVAEREIAEVRSLAATGGVNDLKPWDTAYYGEILKKQRYDIDSENLRPFFALPAVLDGLFRLLHRLYGLHFAELSDVPKYHADVVVYELRDLEDRALGLLYFDFFPRKGKRAGAWMTSYREARGSGVDEKRPWISIVCNFNPPSAGKPSLLSFDELRTLYHEMGHALHGLLAKGPYASLNGTNVYWDFVELPSQFMENWCFEPEVLRSFARHETTGEALPLEMISAIKASANHMIGLQTMRQIGFALLDLEWHRGLGSNAVEEFEARATAPAQMLDRVEGSLISTSFSHIFQGGYSAGYYSYKWAEVLEADAFEAFVEHGLFDETTALKFKKLLETGGQAHPAEVYRAFRGRDADPEALMRRSGLTTPTT